MTRKKKKKYCIRKDKDRKFICFEKIGTSDIAQKFEECEKHAKESATSLSEINKRMNVAFARAFQILDGTFKLLRKEGNHDKTKCKNRNICSTLYCTNTCIFLCSFKIRWACRSFLSVFGWIFHCILFSYLSFNCIFPMDIKRRSTL